MSKLMGLARLMKTSVTNPDKQFLHDLIKSIEGGEEQWLPSPSYKPSSVGGCIRGMYYQIVQAPLDGTPTDYCLIGICDSGTTRHDSLQHSIAKMKEKGFDCEWVDVEEFVNTTQPEGTKVIAKHGMETKCFNSTYNLRFLCDGVIKYRGEYYILEIKTESTYKFNNHDDAYPEHKVQASCYSIALGIDKVIFLYENRDNCLKKTFLVDITPEMKQQVIDKIALCEDHVKSKTVPPKCTEKKQCNYCNYKRQCRQDGV